MSRLSTAVFRGLDLILVVALTSMVFMVFGNVILRYGFGRGIAFSEELSRYCFIWLTFVGAVIALREGTHVGMQTVVARLPRWGRIGCFWASRAIMMICCALLLDGALSQTMMNFSNRSPVAELPMVFVYGVAAASSAAMLAILAVGAMTALRHGVSDAELLGGSSAHDASS